MREKLALERVTLVGVDCIDLDRLLKVFAICGHYCHFYERKILTSLIPQSTKTADGIILQKIPPVNSIEAYSQFMIRELNQFIETDFCLVVQHDGFILNPEGWKDAFFDYDYIGAPWWYRDNNVGNGGFSLRSKELLNRLSNDEAIKLNDHGKTGEDYIICRTNSDYLRRQGIRYAPDTLASHFSLEGAIHLDFDKPYGDIWTGQFGFHGWERTDLSAWKDYERFFGKPYLRPTPPAVPQIPHLHRTQQRKLRNNDKETST